MSSSYVYCRNGRYYSNLFFMCNISNWSSNCCKNICLIIGYYRNKFQRLIICNCKNTYFLFCFWWFYRSYISLCSIRFKFSRHIFCNWTFSLCFKYCCSIRINIIYIINNFMYIILFDYIFINFTNYFIRYCWRKIVYFLFSI